MLYHLVKLIHDFADAEVLCLAQLADLISAGPARSDWCHSWYNTTPLHSVLVCVLTGRRYVIKVQSDKT